MTDPNVSSSPVYETVLHVDPDSAWKIYDLVLAASLLADARSQECRELQQLANRIRPQLGKLVAVLP